MVLVETKEPVVNVSVAEPEIENDTGKGVLKLEEVILPLTKVHETIVFELIKVTLLAASVNKIVEPAHTLNSPILEYPGLVLN